MQSPYEVHITIDPVIDEFEEMALTTLIANHSFKLAQLYKKNGELNKLDSFMTGRFKSLEEAKKKMENCLKDLKDRDFVIRRGKIEEILIDLKFQ